MSNKPLTPQEKKAQQIILTEVDKALDLLHAHFTKYCNEVAPMYNGGEKAIVVPLTYIDQSIKIIKENYRKGAEQPKKSVKDRLRDSERAKQSDSEPPHGDNETE